MKKNKLVICDRDEKYCKKMDSFLREFLSIPFEISEFTDPGLLAEFEHRKDALLIISEKLFSWEIIEGFKNILILEEKFMGLREDECAFGADEGLNIKRTLKYQSGEKIAESILSMCLEMPGIISPGLRCSTKHNMKLIGFYTPVRSIIQTGAALDFTEEMAREHRSLYLNNDSYCSLQQLRADEYAENISDLMYYSKCEPEKFSIYLEKAARKYNKFDFVPVSDGQIRDATAEDYLRLIRAIEETGKYEILVLDIVEGMGLLPELLKACDTVVSLSCQGKNPMERMNIFTAELEHTEEFDMGRLIVADVGKSRDLQSKYLKQSQGGIKQ